MAFILVFTTAGSKREAKKISNVLLSRRLAACCSIIPAHSFYWWNGKIEGARETIVMAKSKKSLFKKIVKAIKSVHSYKCPEIISVAIAAGERGYMNWIKKETAL